MALSKIEDSMKEKYNLTIKTESIEDKEGKTEMKKEYGLHSKHWKKIPDRFKLWCVTNNVTIYSGLDDDFLVDLPIFKFLEMDDNKFLEKYRMLLKDIEDDAKKDRIDLSSHSGISRLFSSEEEAEEMKKELKSIKDEARSVEVNL